MNIDDLARVFKGAKVTINIQTGHNCEMYNGPVQINQTQAAPTLNDTPETYCAICGYTTNGEYAHAGCLRKQAVDDRAYQNRATLDPDPLPRRVTSMPESATVIPQITAPVKKSIFEESAEKYEASYQQIIEAGRAFGRAQSEWLRSLSSNVE